MPQSGDQQYDLPDLFRERPLEAFDEGFAAGLVDHRNRRLGNLLIADRAVFYVQILYRMILFRRHHELEPLYSDIFSTVRSAQREIGGEEYTIEQFRADIDQLTDWNIMTRRIELERLRGYRDTRKRKFRYALTEETVSFLEWLEERYQEDLEAPEVDTRDLLEEAFGSLTQLLELLETRKPGGDSEDGNARRVLYHLYKIEDLNLTISNDLGRFNLRLLTFVMRHYDIDEAKHVLKELDEFVDHFLRQIHEIRGKIIALVNRLQYSRYTEKLGLCFEEMCAEHRTVRHLIRHPQEPLSHERLPRRFDEFYRTNGKLDTLCRRIHDSALRVWRKLHAHLRELERRNNRVEDIRDRTREIAALPPDVCPHTFLNGLLSAAVMRHDPNYWDTYEKADPPRPRVWHYKQEKPVNPFLPRKSRRSATVISMEQARLIRLRDWLQDVVGTEDKTWPCKVSKGKFAAFEDFESILELSRAGLLGNGRKLARAGFGIDVRENQEAEVLMDEQKLSFLDMVVQRRQNSEGPQE